CAAGDVRLRHGFDIDADIIAEVRLHAVRAGVVRSQSAEIDRISLARDEDTCLLKIHDAKAVDLDFVAREVQSVRGPGGRPVDELLVPDDLQTVREDGGKRGLGIHRGLGELDVDLNDVRVGVRREDSGSERISNWADVVTVVRGVFYVKRDGKELA